MMTSTSAPLVQLRTQGSVAEAECDYLRTKLAAALRQAPEPVLFVRARLAVLPDRGVALPAVAQVNVDLNGRVLRVQAARSTLREAIDEVHDRLRDRLDRATRDWEAIRGRHPGTPVAPPPSVRLPADERQVVRHKAFGLRRMTVDQAAFDMEMLGYRFHLFTEEGTGSDSVLYLVEDEPHHRLAQLDPQPALVTPGSLWVSVSTQRPPRLSVEEAISRLDVSGWPFVFFQDVATRRGCVLYHRFDGNYGLISPAQG